MDGIGAVVLDSLEFIIVFTLLAVGYFRGRFVERRHLADLARREQELSGIMTFATRYPAITPHPVDPALVSGGAVIAADYFKMFVAGLRKMVGGRFNAFETLVERGRREAVLRMKEEARAIGATMIFNVRVETTRIQNGQRGGPATVETFAYGTALCPAAGSVAASERHYVAGPPLVDAEAFSIREHPAAIAVMGVWFAAAVFVALDGFAFTRYGYVNGAPWEAFAVLAAGIGAGCAHLLRRRKTPLPYVFSVSLLVTLTLPLLLFVGALRVNALTDTSPATESVYRLREDRSLVSAAPVHPVLEFSMDYEYWAEQEVGSEHRFVLRRGALGFWQFDRDHYAAKVNPFYRARWDARRSPR